MNIGAWCSRSLADAVDLGLLPPWRPLGPYAVPPTAVIPADALLRAHYARRRGEIYVERGPWEVAYDWVRSFSAERDSRWAWRGEGLYDALPIEADVAFDIAVGSLRGLGLRVQIGEQQRVAWARGETRTRIDQLPEPFGMWEQHGLGRARWHDELALELEVSLDVVTTADGTCRLDVSMSTVSLPVLADLAANLGRGAMPWTADPPTWAGLAPHLRRSVDVLGPRGFEPLIADLPPAPKPAPDLAREPAPEPAVDPPAPPGRLPSDWLTRDRGPAT